MNDRHTDPQDGPPVARRVMLSVLAAGGVGFAVAPRVQRAWNGAVEAVSQRDPTGLSGLLPNSGAFRYDNVAASVPRQDDATYRLTVDGLVERPATYTLDALRDLPQTRLVRDVLCTDGWSVQDTPFEGVRLSTLLDAAGVRPEGKALRFTCFDNTYSESLTLPQARRPDVMVALRMQDEPLTHEHGGPARLYVAPMYFYKSAKWLSRITVTDRVVPGYWEGYGWDVDAWLDGAAGR